MIINNAFCTIGISAFRNSNKTVLVCDLNSLTTVYAINNDLQYSAVEAEPADDSVLDRTATYYLAETSSLDTNGYVTFTVDYTVSDYAWSELSTKKVVIKVPTGTELIESSIRLGGTICTNYDYDEDELIITIPVTASSGNIKFSSKAVEDRDVRSYALLTYSQSDSRKQEVIGIIDERVDLFTLYAEKLTSARRIQVEGAAPAQADVNIYVDGTLQTTVTASKAGSYNAEIALNGTATEQIFQITANCTASSGETMTASHSVRYQQEAPELTGFVFYINGDDTQAVDLYGLSQSGIKPAITHTGSRHPYKFVITFENPESIDTLFVTSTRSNIKKSIPAVYDEATGTFIAEGHFDETNKLYVPGTLGLEYNLIHEDMQVGQDIDWDEWRSYLSDDLINGAVIESTVTEVGSRGTIDLSGVSESLGKVLINYSIDLYDETNGTKVSDLMKMIGVVEKIYGYVVPGADGTSYNVILDMRDPEKLWMVVSDSTDISNTAVEFMLSATDFGDDILGIPYTKFETFANTLSTVNTVAGIAYSYYGIQGDYESLCDEIMQSSVISDKSGALKKAEELRDDQVMFMLMTTILPMVVAGGPMAGPTLLLSAMIGSMCALSDVFWQLRVTQIKGENYKIKWHIDPSGYVYDAVSSERLQGVTVTAYCIEYDDTDTFWDYTPSETEYGTLWNALAYNQANPLVTDAEGRYAWDVPEGWWRVKYEKDGYETVWSDWLPVPPPQTEVNIGMVPVETEKGIRIMSQPSDYVGLVGDMATFTVVAEGEGLTYQWYFYDTASSEWKKSSGNTSATMSVEFKAYRVNQEYRCEITDANGNTITTNVVKIVAQVVDLVIVTQPVDYVGSVNDNVSFTVEATGNGLTYQWYYSDNGGTTWVKSGTPGFATNNLLPILRTYRDGFVYYCQITDIFGNTVNSDVVSMTVKASDVVITEAPVDVTGAKLGELYYFEVEATGDNLEYRWEFSSDGGETWQLSWNQGYNTPTLGVRMNANRDGYLYRCKIVSGLKTVVYTEPVSLNLQEPSAVIVGQSGNVAIIANKTATFTVDAEGTDLTYLWYRSNDKGATWNQTYLSGYNTDTLSFVGTVARAAMYMCKVTDGSGKVVWSEPVKLQILSAELKILAQPESITCASGATATFTVEAQGDGLKYQWYASSDGGETWTVSYLGGYNTATFSFAVNATRAAKLYKCVITDAGGNTVETSVVSVTIG